MPNRMLRPWVNSEKVNALSVHSERFFTRLIMVVDDYGCFYADTRLLKANLFPLLLDSIREADLLRWLAECQKAELIVLYEVESKKYLQIVDFKQRLDRAKSKFPKPVNGLPAIVNDFPPEVEDEVEQEVEVEIDVSLIENEKNINNSFFERFRRAAGSHLTDHELRIEVGRFRNKYPNIHLNQCGALINTWIANIGKPKEQINERSKNLRAAKRAIEGK